MKTEEFEVTYRPFPTSDATSTVKINAESEEGAKTEFERIYSRSTFQVVEIKKVI